MELKYFHFKSRTGINLKENLQWGMTTQHTFRDMLHQLSPATTSILYMNTAPTHGMVSHMHTYTTLHPSYSHTHIIMYTYSINTCMTVYECIHTHSIPGLPSCQFCQLLTVDIPQSVRVKRLFLPAGDTAPHTYSAWPTCQSPSPH